MGLNKNEGAFFYPAIYNVYSEQPLSVPEAKSQLSSLEDSLVDRLLESASNFKKSNAARVVQPNNKRQRTMTLNPEPSMPMTDNEAAISRIKAAVKYSYFNSIDHNNLTQIAIKFINVS